MAVVHEATPEEQLALIRAHPELAGKAAIDRHADGRSRPPSRPSAGLDRLTPEEYERFHALNAAYREQFGFPFIICVRLTDKAGILAAMEARLAQRPRHRDRDRDRRNRQDRAAAAGGPDMRHPP